MKEFTPIIFLKQRARPAWIFESIRLVNLRFEADVPDLRYLSIKLS